jgi:hypothetical protein
MYDCTFERKRVAIAEKIADAWNREEVLYAVGHGLERYPQALGRDLDVFVSPRDMERAFDIALRVFRQNGWAFACPRTPYRLRPIYVFKDQVHLQVDLFPGLYWRGVPLVEHIEQDAQIGPFHIDLWAHFAKSILTKLLAGELPGKFNRDVLQDQLVVSKCKHILGHFLSSHLLSVLRRQDEEAIRKISPILRRTLLRRELVFRPWRIIGIFPLLNIRVKRFFVPVAPIVALVGPDGVGKSTILDTISQNGSFPFLGTVVKHWRPGLLPPPAFFKHMRRPEKPCSLVPNRKPGKAHLIRLIYYSIDFFLGHFLKDNPVACTPKLILYDRCALDMAVDPVRYRLASAKGTMISWRIIPKPDMVILLHDKPKRIRARKAELEEKEIERQLNEWLKLAEQGLVNAVIEIDAEPVVIARRIKEVIIRKYVERNGGVQLSQSRALEREI